MPFIKVNEKERIEEEIKKDPEYAKEIENAKINEFNKNRNEALLSLDKEKIIKFSEKWGVKMPQNDLVFWAGVHKAIMYLNAATPEQKEKSMNWLIENDFKVPQIEVEIETL